MASPEHHTPCRGLLRGPGESYNNSKTNTTGRGRSPEERRGEDIDYMCDVSCQRPDHLRLLTKPEWLDTPTGRRVWEHAEFGHANYPECWLSTYAPNSSGYPKFSA